MDVRESAKQHPIVQALRYGNFSNLKGALKPLFSEFSLSSVDKI